MIDITFRIFMNTSISDSSSVSMELSQSRIVGIIWIIGIKKFIFGIMLMIIHGYHEQKLTEGLN